MRHYCTRSEERSLPVYGWLKLSIACEVLQTPLAGSVNPMDSRAVPGSASDVEVRLAGTSPVSLVSFINISFHDLLFQIA